MPSKLRKLTPKNIFRKINFFVSKLSLRDYEQLLLRNGFFNTMQAENNQIGSIYRKYRKQISLFKKEIDDNSLVASHSHSKIIWVCWLQGFDSAPKIVKSCRRSLSKNLPHEYEIIEITEDNWEKYCEFPEYIKEKYRKGLITKTHFSDLIRINLLNNRGGTWIDATILCTGNVPDYMLNSDFFIPQSIYLETLSTAFRIDNFFITASQNNKILLLTERLLWHYWSKNNDLQSYLVFYQMMEIAILEYKEEWRRNIPFSRSNMHLIEERLHSTFNEKDFEEFKRVSPFHKLTYKKNGRNPLFLTDEGNGERYYDYIIKNF